MSQVDVAKSVVELNVEPLSCFLFRSASECVGRASRPMLAWGCGCNYDCDRVGERVEGRGWWREEDVRERFNGCCPDGFTDKSDADGCDMD